MIANERTPIVPPGWEGAAARLIRLVDPSGAAAAWLVNDLGANCIGYAVRRPEGWVQLFDSGTPDTLAERPTRFGCPVLFPFPGHVRGRRYRWAGVEHLLAPLAPGLADYGHGFAPRLPWLVTRSTNAEVECEFHTARNIPGGAAAAGYPFAVRLHLRIRLADRTLIVELAATNEGDNDAPVGLGLHPYFAIAALGGDRAAVRAALPGAAEHRFIDGLTTGERLPVAEREVALPPLGRMLHVPRTALGPRPTAFLRGDKGGIRVQLTALEGARDLLLFAPPAENSVSIEPLSVAPGSASQPEGHPEGLVALAPGATRRLAVTIAAVL